MKIDVSVFITGSNFSSIYTMGAIRGWLEVPHEKKWIRWNLHQEWSELYCDPHADKELHSHFDKYLRGVDNDREKMPKVRWSALQFGERESIDNIELADFPVPNTQYKEFHLLGSDMTEAPASKTGIFSYNSEDSNSIAEFAHKFTQKSRLIGLPKAAPRMSSPSHDDMNVFVILRKRGNDGKLLMHFTFPFSAVPKEYKTIEDILGNERASLNLHLGSVGALRASHRAFDPELSIHEQFPFHLNDKEEKITPGEVVKLEIGIWSTGVDFDAGE
jgi:predicted acyl esterase